MYWTIGLRSARVVCVLGCLWGSAASAEPRGLPVVFPRTIDAKLVCRIGPSPLTQGQTCAISETLQCENPCQLKSVTVHMYRVAFFHRGLKRMVMMESGDKLAGYGDLPLMDLGNGQRISDTKTDLRLTHKFTAVEPGIFTINVEWLIKREKPDGSGWMETVESGPVLLVVRPTDEWRRQQRGPVDQSPETDLFATGDYQSILEGKYVDGEHEP